MGPPAGIGLENQGCVVFLNTAAGGLLVSYGTDSKKKILKSFFLLGKWGIPLLEITWPSEIGVLKHLCSVFC